MPYRVSPQGRRRERSPAPAAGPQLRESLLAMAGGSAGNLVEWYDWLVYSTFSIYFSPVFFPNGDRTAQLMNTAAIFAVGYLMRPLGSVLLGYYADRRGRREALVISVVMMCFGALIVALTPGYAQIGLLAPGLLVFARLFQGLSVGGEYGASAVYLVEIAPPLRRGFFASFHYLTLLAGQLLAILTLVLLQHVFLTPQQLSAWGWRIPFLVGAGLSVCALYLRRRLPETPDFKKTLETKRTENPLRTVFREPRKLLVVAGLTVGGSLGVNTFTVYMPKFLVNTSGFSVPDATKLSAITVVALMLMQPIGGALSDRIGRKPLLLTFGVLGSIAVVPLMMAIGATRDFGTALSLIFVGLVIVAGYSSVNAVVKAELFPPETRALGVGLPYALVVAVFGGTAEYFGLLFKHAGYEIGFYWYVAASIFVSLLFYIRLPETRPGDAAARLPAGSHPVGRGRAGAV